MATEPPPYELDLSEDVEGNQDGTTDFVFRAAGDPIPLLPPSSSSYPLFDLRSPPSRPLAVSDRLAAVFLAHPQGFMVARTKDLIGAAKEAREEGKPSTRCVQDCCVADVPLAGVSLLELSRDSSTLAACAGGEMQFFSANALLNDKDVKPSSLGSIGESGIIKDFKWLNNAATSYVVLSNSGLLYHGSLKEDLKDIIENVNAVDCCPEGNYIAVARQNTLSILSLDLKEQCHMSLLFQLWSGDSNSAGTIKVDSIGWVRCDSIIVGCVRLNEEGDEEGYLVQVITSRGNSFFESSSKPAVFSYPDFFGGIKDDILPAGVGPHLLFSYVHRWELMVASNRKNIDQHIMLLKWSATDDGKKELVYLEMLEDKYNPRIDLQENGDDNVILGFGAENVSLFEKINVQVGPENKELAPQHILLCLTGEGKLIIYYIARISDPSYLPQSNLSFDEDIGAKQHLSTATVTGNDLTTTVTGPMDNSMLKVLDGDQHTSMDMKSRSAPGRDKEMFIFSNEKPLNTTEVNVASSHPPDSSLVPKDNNMKPEIPYFGSSAANNVEATPTGSKASDELVSSWQVSSSGSGSSSSLNSQLGKGEQKPMNATEVNVASPIQPISSLVLKDNMRPEIPYFGSSAVNNVEATPTRSKASDELVSSWQVSSSGSGSSSSLNSQLGKGVPGSAQLERVFVGSHVTKKQDTGSLSFKSSVFTSDRSVSNKVGEKTLAGVGNQLPHSPQSNYIADRKIFGPSGGLSSESSSLLIPSNLSQPGSSSSTMTGNVEAIPTSHVSRPVSQEAIGKSQYNRVPSAVEYSGHFKTGSMLDSEQDLPNKFYSVHSMTKELDALLSSIEKEGGFRDACTISQQHSLSLYEDALQNLLELSQIFKSKVEDQVSNIEDLVNKKFQVSARLAYMKGIVSQSSDSEYWDIWNRQKLGPEFESKRQNILNVNQNLINQLIELERHFNSLEMNRFGETGRVTSSWKATYANISESRQTPLFSVYNALNSQLEAAEQLSECLSKQISALNISSPSMKRGAVTKELFESIGLVHEPYASQFSDETTSKTMKRNPSSMKERTKSISGAVCAEPETARRRRESLDRSLASLEPQKTTVKRIAEQQRVKISSDLPFRSNKKIFDSQMAVLSRQKSSGSPTSSMVESYLSRLKPQSEVLPEKPLRSPSGSQQNSLFKWVKQSPGASQGLQPKYNELEEQMQTATQPSKSTSPSPAPSFKTHMNVRDNSTSAVAASFRTTHTDHKPNSLTFQTISNTRTNANRQLEAAHSMTSAKVSESPSAAKTSRVELRGQATLTNRQDDLVIPSSGGTKQLGVPSQNFTSVWDLNTSSLSSERSKPVLLHGETAQLSESTKNVQNPAKSVSVLAPQPSAALTSSSAQSLSLSSTIESGVSTSAMTSSPSTQASAGAVSAILPPMMSSIFPSQKSIPEDTLSSSFPSLPAVKETCLDQDRSKHEVVTSQITGSADTSTVAPSLSTTESRPALPTVISGNLPSTPDSTAQSVIVASTKDVGPDSVSSDEDDMEEEAPSSSAELNLGALGGFGLGSMPLSSPQKSNPFGVSFNTSNDKSSVSPFTISPGQLFRPASLSIPSAQPAQSSQSASSGTFSSPFSSGLSGFGQPAQIGAGQQAGFGQPAQIGAGPQTGFGQPAQIGAGAQTGFGQPAHIGAGQQSGFGRPAQIGAGQLSGFGQPAQVGSQQALGSVLGSFGQSRQLGGFGGGGFGGFASAATSGGFSSVSASGAGFAGAASGGGFAAAATSGGGFAALASKSGGFAAAASIGSGAGGAGQGGSFGAGGFGAFGSNQGSAFSAYGGNSAAGPGRPPSDFLTQMRK